MAVSSLCTTEVQLKTIMELYAHYAEWRRGEYDAGISTSRSDVLHTVKNSVQVQTLPTAQATPALTDSFSRGYDPHTHACKAKPLTIVGWTSLSVSLSLSL